MRTVNVFYEIKLHALFQPTERAKNYRESNEKIRRDSHSDVQRPNDKTSFAKQVFERVKPERPDHA